MTTDEEFVMDGHMMEVFFDVQSELPRQGPGDRDSTLSALRACSELVDGPRVLDVGCGPGTQTMVLAEALPDSLITAIDFHQPYLDELRSRAHAAGIEGRVRTRKQDMGSLPFKDRAFDLIWAEGSAYILGVEKALSEWRPILEAGGYLALTDLVWLTGSPPRNAVEFWENGYPAMTTREGVIASIRAAGYESVHSFTLPDSAWWGDYYTPLADRLPGLEEKYATDDVARSVIEQVRTEIAMREECGQHYGYQFFIARKPESRPHPIARE
jgi:ubiquinone/menaquinone biosynthesis C-methylase UbiE